LKHHVWKHDVWTGDKRSRSAAASVRSQAVVLIKRRNFKPSQLKRRAVSNNKPLRHHAAAAFLFSAFSWSAFSLACCPLRFSSCTRACAAQAHKAKRAPTSRVERDHSFDRSPADCAEGGAAREHDAIYLRPVVSLRFVVRAFERTNLVAILLPS